jgi:mono/diheme cytochrome c family protein
MLKRFIRLAVCLSLAACLAGCGGGDQSQRPRQAADAGQTDAETIYKRNCMSCHGGNLEGKMGPALQKAGSKWTKEQITDILREGKNGMPSFKNRLDEQQIETLAAWLSAKK